MEGIRVERRFEIAISEGEGEAAWGHCGGSPVILSLVRSSVQRWSGSLGREQVNWF